MLYFFSLLTILTIHPKCLPQLPTCWQQTILSKNCWGKINRNILGWQLQARLRQTFGSRRYQWTVNTYEHGSYLPAENCLQALSAPNPQNRAGMRRIPLRNPVAHLGRLCDSWGAMRAKPKNCLRVAKCKLYSICALRLFINSNWHICEILFLHWKFVWNYWFLIDDFNYRYVQHYTKACESMLKNIIKIHYHTLE